MSERAEEQRMKEETILVLLKGLFLLVLFLVAIASDVVAAAILPVISREKALSGITDLKSRLHTHLTVRE